MRKALPVLLAATALTFASTALPAYAADGSADATTENPAPVQESWMAGPEKPEPSTGEQPSSAEAVDEEKVEDGAADTGAAGAGGADDGSDDAAAGDGDSVKTIDPEALAGVDDEGWIDPDADIATADPDALGVTEHKVEIYKPLGTDPLPSTLDAK